MQGQHISQRIHGRVHLRAFAPFGSVIARPRSRLGRRLQGAAVGNHRPGLRLASGKLTQQRAQILHHGFETTGSDPTLGLLIHHRPRRQIMRHHAPVRSRSHQPAQRVEHRSQRVFPLLGVFPAQSQIRCYEGPFLITHITRIGRPASIPHPLILRDNPISAASITFRGVKVNNSL